MTKYFISQILLTAIRVNDITRGIFSHGIDGEIATRQIFFQRDIGCRMAAETMIAMTGFTFRTRQCIFFMRLRMQKHRKVFADRLIPCCNHLLWGPADDNVVSVTGYQAQQTVTNRTTHNKGFHDLNPSSRGVVAKSLIDRRGYGIQQTGRHPHCPEGIGVQPLPVAEDSSPAARRSCHCRRYQFPLTGYCLPTWAG